ncbi:MAG: hypothetical protein ACPL3C_10510 [Pyrobaculum sp.]|uniref:hypothetical protein n=1 Tax=Pyrobaculum sp. 3827-6 TaxID=2983604 RepID=UPI0021D88D96|nr:hypothetical protein [Pyrobaculum sp. 3827-6]MCU7788017.1 hypothetical protein [Pyrobaculum sp. 3827-6]
MRWVVELVFASALLGLVFALFNYTSPLSMSVQVGERGRFSELALFAMRLASSPDFLFRLQTDWDSALLTANAEAGLIDPLARVSVVRPVGGVCPTVPSPRFSISVASVMPNGTAVCIAVYA